METEDTTTKGSRAEASATTAATGADQPSRPSASAAGGESIPSPPPAPPPAPPAASPPAAPRAKRPARVDVRKSTLALASVAILAGGILVGIRATRYVAGIPTANAATEHAAATPARSGTQKSVDEVTHAWNPFQEIRDMQRHMDQMFDQMTTNFHLAPGMGAFSDSPGYSLSLNLRDLKDHYEVRAYLPDAKASDVKVSLLDKQTLKVEVSNTSKPSVAQGGHGSTVTEWGQYAQIIRLPAPVRSEQMAVDQPHHELIVTLPKANG
jgi:HSP20 family molecular chaperone IbpA